MRTAYRFVHRELRRFWQGQVDGAGNWQSFIESTDPRLLRAALMARGLIGRAS